MSPRLPPPAPSRCARFVPSRFVPAGFAAAGLLLAAAVRYPLLQHRSRDYDEAFSPWYDFIVANGHFGAMQYDFADYNTPYLYLLAAAALLFPALPKLLAVKAPLVLFDFLLAFFVSRSVRRRYPDSKALPFLAGLLTLFLPGVLLNGAMWGQSDPIYTTFLVAGFLLLLRDRPVWAFAAFGLALSFKLQAFFLAPAIWWLSTRKPIGWRPPLAGAAVFLLALVPAWLAGRPFYDLLLIYPGQTVEHSFLSRGAPTLWSWISNDWYAFWPLGLLLAALPVLGVAALVAKSRTALTDERLVTLAAFSLLLLPFILPKMHERYFFPAEVFVLLLAFWRPRLCWAPVALSLVSAQVYLEELRDWAPWPVEWSAAVHLLVVAALGRQVFSDLGYRGRLREIPARILRRARPRARAAVPLVLLLSALGAAFLFARSEGRFSRPPAGEEAAALARAGNLSPKTRFVPFTHRTLAPDGAPAFVRGADAPLGGGLALGALLGAVGDDPARRLTAARAAMAALFGAAAALAYLSLVRLFRRRWLALGVTLLAFSPFAGGAWDAVSLEESPTLFALFLSFHGMAMFVREGRSRQLFLKCAAGLLVSYSVVWLLLPFAAVGFLRGTRWRETRWRETRRRRAGEPVSRARFPSPTPSPTPSPASSPAGGPSAGGAGPAPVRPALRRSYLAVGAFGLLFGGAVFGWNRANDWILTRTGARLVEAPDADSSDADSSDADSSDTGPAASGAGRDSLRRTGGALVPYVFEIGGRARGENDGGVTGPVFLALLAALGGIAAAGLPDRRLRPVAGGRGAGGLFVSAAAALFLLSGYRVGATGFHAAGFDAAGPDAVRPDAAGPDAVGPDAAGPDAAGPDAVGPDAAGPDAAGPDAVGPDAAGFGAGARGPSARIGADLDRIRRTLEIRTGEPVVFVRTGIRRRPALRAPGSLSFHLPGVVLVERAVQRGLAEFEIGARSDRDRPIPDAGLLTPGNSEVFLYLRAAADGGVAGMIAAAGPPVVRGEFDLYLHDDLLLYVREDCRPEHREGRFVLHLDPRDPDDLPPIRRPYGFENRSFSFDDRAVERGRRCVAHVRLPDYPIRRVVTGRHPGRSGRDFVWRVEFAPKFAPTR